MMIITNVRKGREHEEEIFEPVEWPPKPPRKREPDRRQEPQREPTPRRERKREKTPA